MLGIIMIGTSALNAENLKLHFIDVRQGDAILIQYEGENYLVDSGKNLSSDKLITYLDSIGVTILNCCLITHPDFDHYGEFEDLIESGIFIINRFIVNKDTSTNVTYQSLMDLLLTENIPVDSVDYQDELEWTVDADILSPDYENGFSGNNDNSIVIKMSLGEIDFLLTGDSCEDNNQYLMNNYDLDVEVLKVSHHGGIDGTSEAFLAHTTPILSIISSGNNSYGHPSPEVIGLLQDAGSEIYSTADDWNTWWINGGNGSNDESLDDDIFVETDGISIWVNGQLVWTNYNVQQTGTITPICEVFPHPCTGSVKVRFSIEHKTSVEIDVFDIKGRIIKQLLNDDIMPGNHELVWEVIDIPPGIYFCRFQYDEYQRVMKLLILE